MAVSHTFAAEQEQFFQQIDNIIKSHSLRGSESLCRLLQYLAKQSLYQPQAPLKEYQIATEVYGRPRDFDPQHDSTIRVQAGRLRLKLAEYYSTEGAADTLVVEIPKGTYVVSFHNRVAPLAKPLSSASRDLDTKADVKPGQGRPGWPAATIVLSVLLAFALAAIALLLANGAAQKRQQTSERESAPAVFSSFWKSFVTGPEEPWVIFSNGAFIGRPETGMRYFDSNRDSRDV